MSRWAPVPATIERTIRCALRSAGGRIETICGVELEHVDWSEVEPEDEIVTCPACIDEMIERWGCADEAPN